MVSFSLVNVSQMLGTRPKIKNEFSLTESIQSLEAVIPVFFIFFNIMFLCLTDVWKLKLSCLTTNIRTAFDLVRSCRSGPNEIGWKIAIQDGFFWSLRAGHSHDPCHYPKPNFHFFLFFSHLFTGRQPLVDCTIEFSTRSFSILRYSMAYIII